MNLFFLASHGVHQGNCLSILLCTNDFGYIRAKLCTKNGSFLLFPFLIIFIIFIINKKKINNIISLNQSIYYNSIFFSDSRLESSEYKCSKSSG